MDGAEIPTSVNEPLDLVKLSLSEYVSSSSREIDTFG
jgi:hypothetical protein